VQCSTVQFRTDLARRLGGMTDIMSADMGARAVQNDSYILKGLNGKEGKQRKGVRKKIERKKQKRGNN
jgi:hypothetical protein